MIKNFKSLIFKDKKGFTAVELILTVSLFAFGIFGIYTFFYPAYTLSANFSNRTAADYLAQEAMEIITNIRDNNIIKNQIWSQNISGCDSGCQLDYKTKTPVETPSNALKSYADTPLNLDSNSFYSYDSGTATIFKRKVTITPGPNSDILKVVGLVTWDYNGKSFSYDTTDYIYKLKP